jgi:hypothetical protein
LIKVGADGVQRELQARWISETLMGLTVFVATEHCTIPLDRAEAQRFARWLTGQVEEQPLGRRGGRVVRHQTVVVRLDTSCGGEPVITTDLPWFRGQPRFRECKPATEPQGDGPRAGKG